MRGREKQQGPAGQGGRGGRGGTPAHPSPDSRNSPAPGRGARPQNSPGLGLPTRGGHGAPGGRGRGAACVARGGQGAPGRFSGTPTALPAGGRPPPQPVTSGRGYRPGQGGGPNYREPHGSAKLFGSGPEKVQFEKDKEPGIWKVGPPPGQRFSPAFLQGVSKFVAYQLSRQQQRQQQQGGQRSPSATAPLPPPPSQPLASSAGLGAAAGVGAGHGRPVAATPPGSPQPGSVAPASAGDSPGDEGAGALPTTPAQQLRQPGLEPRGLESGALGLVEEEEEGGEPAGAWEGGVSEDEGELEGGTAADGDPQDSDGLLLGPLEAQYSNASSSGTGSSACGPAVMVALEVSEAPRQPGERGPGGANEADGGQAKASEEPPGSSMRVILRLNFPEGPEGPPAEAAAAAGHGSAVENGSAAGPEPAAARALAGAGGCGVTEAGVAAAAAAGRAGEPSAQQQGGNEGQGQVGPGSRVWWSVSALAEEAPEEIPVAEVEEEGAAGGAPAAEGRVQLSLRLERMGITDREAGMLADWHARTEESVCLRKLWLFDDQLGDEGARHVARMLHPGMLELHLSHNRITAVGAGALLRALAAAPAPPARPLWLRLEWNRVSLEALVQMLEREHSERGLVVDIPQPTRSDAAPSLPCLPAYLSSACTGAGASIGQAPAAAGHELESHGPDSDAGCLPDLPASPAPSQQSSGPPFLQQRQQQAGLGRGGARNSLRFLVGKCHARLPWLSCQYQLPAEAAVLRTVRSTWSAAGTATAAAGAAAVPQPLAAAASPLGTATQTAGDLGSLADRGGSSGGEAGGTTQPPQLPEQTQRGPLLLFPDTSALLSMLGAHSSVAQRTAVTLRALADLAQAGLFGRAMEPQEQVFVVVTDSVAKQLDGLKADPAARAAIRHFMGQGLDAYGPAGLDFLTVLGGHEGEGLVVEHEAQVAGSRSRDVGSVGQKMDHKIVEVALFFQREILQAAAPGLASHGSIVGASSSELAAFPVVLISGDNAQVQLAKSHGLPAVRLGELAPLERWMQQHAQQALGASLARKLLGPAATIGLGSVALRSIHQEFDGAVACLRAATDVLHAAHSTLAAMRAVLHDSGGLNPDAVLCTLRALLPPAAQRQHQQPRTGTGCGHDTLGQAPGGAGGLSASIGGHARAAGAPAVGAQPLPPLLQQQQQQQQGQHLGVDWLGQAGELVAAVQQKLGEWEGLVQSHQSPHRVLKWAGTQ